MLSVLTRVMQNADANAHLAVSVPASRAEDTTHQCTQKAGTTRQEDFQWGYLKEADPPDTLHRGPMVASLKGAHHLIPPWH
jgi:hypothetical protein